MNGVNQDFRNTSNEIFVASIGDQIADTLKFFNVKAAGQADNLISNPNKFKEIKKVELQQEGIAYMSTYSGKSHLSIVMASINGSLYVWNPRPAKIIQPLAPNFVEIEDNICYVERESEFDSEVSSEEETPEERVGDGAFGRSMIAELTKKQRKLAVSEVDVYGLDPLHQASQAQQLPILEPSLNTELEQLFVDKGDQNNRAAAAD